jgi:hypothetical protein
MALIRCNACTGKFNEEEAQCADCSDHSDCFSADDLSSARHETEDAASRVFDWAERWRILKGMPKETWDLFQECVEDLRA